MGIKNFFSNLFLKNHDDDNDEPGVKSVGIELPEGAVRGYGMSELMGRAVSTPEGVYVPVRISVYEDEWEFEFNRYEGEEISSRYETFVTRVPGTPDEENVSVIIDGIEFVWDDYDEFFRWNPFGEGESLRTFNDYVEYFSNGELRIDKAYAVHNLSLEALAYSYFEGEGYYSFNVHDGTYAPVMFEMPSVFDKKGRFEVSRFEYFQAEKASVVGDLMCTNRYIQQKYPGKSIPELYMIYQQNEQRALWEPEAL